MTSGTAARTEKSRAELAGQLREALAAFDAGDAAGFDRTLDEVMRSREEGLFENLGKLTRELHRSVEEFRMDDRLSRIAGDIPDACGRLDYVVQVSEKAAHETLDLVEACRKIALQLSQAGTDVAGVREHLLHKPAMTPPEAQQMASHLYSIQGLLQRDTAELRKNLSHLAQAQEYQDLSGQIIKRVTELVREVEGALIDLLRASGTGLQNVAPRPITGLSGPAVPGQSRPAVSQQDADELLASLGF